MKKYLLSIGVLMMALVFFAFTNKHISKKTAPFTSFYWFDISGTAYDGFSSHATEKTLSTCPDVGSNDCRRGYNQNQLKDPANPSMGVLSSQVNSPIDRILKN